MARSTPVPEHAHEVPADLHVTAAGRLREGDQRYTRGRRTLVALLAETDRPLTIAELLDHDADLAQSSAYRNLGVLEEAGVVQRVVTDDEFTRYELTEDLTGHHHHLICRTCGRVEDFTISTKLESSLSRAFERVTAETGFVAEHHRLDLVGTCAGCG